MKKRIFVIILAISYLFSLTSAYAAESNDHIDVSSDLYTSAISFESAYTFNAGEPLPETRSELEMQMETFSISGEADSVNFAFSTSSGKDFIFSGQLYPVIGQGFYDGRLVLGDFAPSAEHNIVLFRIEKQCDAVSLFGQNVDLIGKNVLVFVLENVDDGTISLFETELTEGQYNNIYSVAKKYHDKVVFDESDYYDFSGKTLDLLTYNNNWKSIMNRGAIPAAARATSSYDSFTSSNTGVSATFTGLAEVWNELYYNNNNETEVSFNSTIGRVLSQTGWKYYHNDSSSPWFYVMYSFNNGLSNMVQMTIVSYSTSYNENASTASTHFYIEGSLAMEYCIDYLPGTLRLLYYDMGPTLNNCYVTCGDLAGSRTFFTSAECSYRLGNNNSPWEGILFSKIPLGSEISSIWSWLTQADDFSKWETSFHNTYDSQIQSYGGLVKDICIRTDDNSLRG